MHKSVVMLRGALLLLGAAGSGALAVVAVRRPVVVAATELATLLGTPGDAPAALSAATLLLAASALLATWLWLLACLVTCVVDELRTPSGREVPQAPSAFRPRLVRLVVRLLVGGVASSAVALSVSPAQAADDRDLDPIVVAGLLLPDRVVGAGPAAAPDAVPGPTGAVPGTAAPVALPPPVDTVEAPAPAATGRVTVAPGDTLWGLAESLLPPGAEVAAVDEAWRELHAANRAAVGADPDLIVPGTVLTVPTDLGGRS